MPQGHCWAAEHAPEVQRQRLAGMTMVKLAEHFGKSIPTIRHALQLAAKDPAAGMVPETAKTPA